METIVGRAEPAEPFAVARYDRRLGLMLAAIARRGAKSQGRGKKRRSFRRPRELVVRYSSCQP